MIAVARPWRGVLPALGILAVLLAAAQLAPASGYTLNILMQAVTYAVAVAGLVVVLGYCGQISLAQAAFFGLGAYGVAVGTVDLHWPFFAAPADGRGGGGRVRPGARLRQPAPGRALPRHGDDQLPANPHARADQLGGPDARSGRHPRHPAPRRADGWGRLPVRVPGGGGGRHVVRVAAQDQPLGPGDAGGAGQRDRRKHLRHRRVQHQGGGVRPQRRAGRGGRRAVRRGVQLHQPGPVQLRRVHRAADHGAARRGAVAVRGAAGHGAAGDAAGVAALPAPGVPGGVRRRGGADHGVPAGRPCGA